jgi:resolvase-like protein
VPLMLSYALDAEARGPTMPRRRKMRRTWVSITNAWQFKMLKFRTAVPQPTGLPPGSRLTREFRGVLHDHYDDGGYSGGAMDRPALRRLLAEVTARRVDVVLVYIRWTA